MKTLKFETGVESDNDKHYFLVIRGLNPVQTFRDFVRSPAYAFKVVQEWSELYDIAPISVKLEIAI